MSWTERIVAAVFVAVFSGSLLAMLLLHKAGSPWAAIPFGVWLLTLGAMVKFGRWSDWPPGL